MHEGCEHGRRSVWCVVNADVPVVRCRCGLSAFGTGWAAVDVLAAQQFVDPDGVQLAFCDAAGLLPAIERALETHRARRDVP